MKLTFVSYDGNTVSIASRVTFDEQKISVLSNPKLSPKYLTRAEAHPLLVAVNGKVRIIEMEIILSDKTTTPYTKRSTLAGLFNATDYTGTLKTLIAQDDETTGNTQYQLSCVVTDFVWNDDTKIARVTLVAPNPVWKAVSSTTETITNPASGDSSTGLIVGGNVDVLPVIELTPTGARSGDGNYIQSFVTIISNQNRAFRNKFIAVELNTAAIITATQSDTDLFGMRLTINNKFVDRYIGAPNTTGSQLWFLHEMQPHISATLGTALTTGAETEIVFANTVANMDALEKLPRRGQVKIDNEIFRFRNPAADGWWSQDLKLINVVRAKFGTTAAAHSAAATIDWIQDRIEIEYGDTGLTVSQNSGDAAELAPMFETGSSTLSLRKYLSTGNGFADRKGHRGLEWKPEPAVVRRPTQKRFRGDNDSIGVYTAVHTGTSGSSIPAYANPATYLGLAIRALEDGNNHVLTRGVTGWRLRHPWGITDVTVTGQKFSTTTGDWIKFLGLKSSRRGENWKEQWSEAALSTGNEWANLSTGVQAVKKSLGATHDHILLEMRGAVNGGATRHQALSEISAVDVYLSTSRMPTVTLGTARTSQYEIKNLKLVNNTISPAETLQIKNLTVAVNTKIKIDVENMLAYIDDNSQRNIIERVFTDTNRKHWLKLKGGVSNAVEFTDVGTGNITVAYVWHDRNN